MALSEFDRDLLKRCLSKAPRSWEDFADRFLGLTIHVVNHTTQSRGLSLTDQDREDLVADVFLALVRDDFGVLRQFRGNSSLATYLTVVARRVVVREILRRGPMISQLEVAPEPVSREDAPHKLSDREEVERLISGLSGTEAEIVRLYHLEGKTYREISVRTGLPENSIGPTLSRARSKMRQAAS